MRMTIQALLNDSEIQQYYHAAIAHWNEVLSDVDRSNPTEISRIASNQQHWFETNCGGRYLGQEIMVVAGIGGYFSAAVGFDANLTNAKAMYQGFMNADGCSGEIRGHAEDMAKVFDELVE